MGLGGTTGPATGGDGGTQLSHRQHQGFKKTSKNPLSNPSGYLVRKYKTGLCSLCSLLSSLSLASQMSPEKSTKEERRRGGDERRRGEEEESRSYVVDQIQCGLSLARGNTPT